MSKKTPPLWEHVCSNCKHWKEETEPGDDERAGECRAGKPDVALYIHGITIEIPPGALAESLRAAARVLDRLADDTDHPPELMGS